MKFIITLLLLSCATFGELKDRIVATVNGEIILLSELRSFQKSFPQLRHLDQRLSQVDPEKIKDQQYALDLPVEDLLIKQYINCKQLAGD